MRDGIQQIVGAVTVVDGGEIRQTIAGFTAVPADGSQYAAKDFDTEQQAAAYLALCARFVESHKQRKGKR